MCLSLMGKSQAIEVTFKVAVPPSQSSYSMPPKPATNIFIVDLSRGILLLTQSFARQTVALNTACNIRLELGVCAKAFHVYATRGI